MLRILLSLTLESLLFELLISAKKPSMRQCKT